MLSGLTWKPWLRGNFTLKRRRANRRMRLVTRVVYSSLNVLGNQAAHPYQQKIAPTLGILLRWAQALWLGYSDFYSRLCSLSCLSLVQNALGLNPELAPFFAAYHQSNALESRGWGTALVPQRIKRFFFIRQRPKRFMLWYWGAVLSQFSAAAILQRRPHRVLRVLPPASFTLKRKKLKHPRT